MTQVARRGMSRHRLIDLPVRPDDRGKLTFIEGQDHVPFEIQRVFFVTEVPGDRSRGGHACKTVEEVIIAASGSFDVVLEYAGERTTLTLDRPDVGLYVPSLVWRELENFSSGSVCLVLASTPYSEDDYYRDYEQFRAARSARDSK